MPEDTAGRAREWAEKEVEKQKIIEDTAAFDKYLRTAPEAMK